jgi:hypothetical protein
LGELKGALDSATEPGEGVWRTLLGWRGLRVALGASTALGAQRVASTWAPRE